MSKSAKPIRVLQIDPDGAARTAFMAIEDTDIEVCLHPIHWPVSVQDAASGFDVVIVGVDTAIGLQLLADLCTRPAAPPVIALAASGFEGKSLEHVLLLAEVRGAAATMTKPADAVEMAFAVRAVVALRHAAAAPERRSA